MLTKSNHRVVIALVMMLSVPFVVLISLTACAGQVSDLKIVDLQGDQVVRIDSGGSVFDATDKKVAVINDREGSFTFLKPIRDTQKIAFKNDPAVQRDNDHYVVKIGDGAVFDVKPDGSVSFNGQPWARVFGYKQSQAQKDRFVAAIVLIPFLEANHPFVALPRDIKNADQDSAVRRQSKIWIPTNDEIYVDDEQIPRADFGARLDEKIDEFLKRPAEANRIIYIASSINVEWGTIVQVINTARERGVGRIGLVVQGKDPAKNYFLLQIPPLPDPNEDLSKLKPDPLLLGVALRIDLQIELITGGLKGFHLYLPYPQVVKREPKGILTDTSILTQTLGRIFQQRKEQHVYRPGMEARTDLPEDQRIEKTVVIKAPRASMYGDVIKIIDAVKGTGANPIVLQLDDLP